MIKTILVGLDGSEPSRAALGTALWLGEKFQSRIVGLHVIDLAVVEGSLLHDISGALGFEPFQDFAPRVRAAMESRGEALLQDFSSRCAEAGLDSETRLVAGIVPVEIADAARSADLVVMGRSGESGRLSEGLLGSTTENVTRRSPRPVLVVQREVSTCRSPLLAWDGSPAAAAAMQSAAEFCSTLALPLTVVSIHADADAAREILAEAESYLKAWNIRTRCESVASAHAPESLVAFTSEGGHDLLFLGAYGHSRILSMILGRTTEYVLRHTTCPLFLHR